MATSTTPTATQELMGPDEITQRRAAIATALADLDGPIIAARASLAALERQERDLKTEDGQLAAVQTKREAEAKASNQAAGAIGYIAGCMGKLFASPDPICQALGQLFSRFMQSDKARRMLPEMIQTEFDAYFNYFPKVGSREGGSSAGNVSIAFAENRTFVRIGVGHENPLKAAIAQIYQLIDLPNVSSDTIWYEIDYSGPIAALSLMVVTTQHLIQPYEAGPAVSLALKPVLDYALRIIQTGDVKLDQFERLR